MLISILILLFIVLSPLIFSHPQFGGVAKGGRLERIRMSSNFSEEKFKNAEPTVLMTGGNRLSAIKMLFRRSAEELSPKPGELHAVKTDLKHLGGDDDLYIWFGHSSFLLRLGGKIVLVDPVFFKAAPARILVRPFREADIYKPSDMPERIDYLLISHDHWDHLDYNTVKALRHNVGRVVCPLGVGADFKRWGYSEEQIVELDWEQTWSDSVLSFTAKETRHFTGRGFWNPKTMPAAWYIKSPLRNIFYTGDGGWGSRFQRFAGENLDIDLAILENGQYNEAWSQIHTLPKYLGEEVSLLSPKRFTTVHHSKYCLSTHRWDEPLRNEETAERESGVPLVRPYIGVPVHL